MKIPLPDMGPEIPYEIISERRVAIEVDDGESTLLYAHIFRPDAEGPFPTLLYATAYRKEVMSLVIPPRAQWLASQGYAVVVMDVRGTGASEGGWESFSEREIDDLVYIIDHWIPSKEWSNGKVGMYGPSYMGVVQYLAAARKPDHLKVIFPGVSMADAYRDVFYHGGIFDQEFIFFWAGATVGLGLIPGTQILSDPISALRALVDHAFQIPEILSWLEMTTDQAFFDTRSPMHSWDLLTDIPTFATAGWFCIFTRGSLLNHTNLTERSSTGGAPRRMAVGPWYHYNGAIMQGLPGEALHKRWFDWHLKADEDPLYHRYDILEPEYPVHLYVMGACKWRKERQWPLERAQYQSLYLSGRAQAHDQNESINNGSLHWSDEIEGVWNDAEATEPTGIAHNPPDFAGKKSRSFCRWIVGLIAFMPFTEDERENECMTLTFSTPPLEEDLEVTGPLVIKFWARSNFGEASPEYASRFTDIEDDYGVDLAGIKEAALDPDVHWIVNVNDVYPDGRVRNLTSGWLAASHRRDPERPDWTQPGYDPFVYPEDETPVPIVEGDTTEYVIEIWPTANIFQVGHQIRIDIVNSDVPHLLPSYVPSESEILHDRDHPSQLIIPVVETEPPESNRWIEDPEAYFSGKVPWESFRR
ncbi:CocE/NonD family hydrolase [Thermodesulfobacteriota bacterium]